MAFLSIIIPTYNSFNLIAKCLKSIRNQTYQEYEVIIIDGQSTDCTLLAIEGFQDGRIKIYSEPDLGIYDAMNKGIEKASGEWIYFLGSDDTLYEPDILQKINGYILNSNLDIIYGNIISTRFNGLYGGEFNTKKIFHQNICHQAIFFKSTVFKKIGIFNLKYKRQADWDHNMKWLASINIVKLHINQIIAEYADGGFSSHGEDLVFKKHKLGNYLLYNKNGMNLKEKIKLIYKENMRFLRQRDLKQILNNILKIPQIIWRLI